MIAYSISTPNREEDKSESRIWMIAATGGRAIALTADGAILPTRVGSPDANGLRSFRLATKAKPKVGAQSARRRSAKAHGHAAGRERLRLVAGFHSPGLVLRDPTDEELDAAKTNKDKSPAPSDAGKSKEAKTQKPWVIDRLQFKVDEVGYLDRRRTHLYTFTLAGKAQPKSHLAIMMTTSRPGRPTASLCVHKQPLEARPDATYNKDIGRRSDNAEKGAHPTQVTTNR